MIDSQYRCEEIGIFRQINKQKLELDQSSSSFFVSMVKDDKPCRPHTHH